MIQFKRLDPISELLLDFKITKDNYLRVDFDFDDDYIRQCIESATTFLENELRMPIYKADYSIIINLTDLSEYDYPRVDPYLDFKKIAVESIDDIHTLDIYGVQTTLVAGADNDYIYNAATNRLYFPSKKNIATTSISHMLIEARLGWDLTDLPVDIRQSLYAVTAHFYENRGTNTPVPVEVLNPVAHYKRWY